VRALTSHQKLATQVLKSDRQGMTTLTDVIYQLLRENEDLRLD
jgi:type I restriction enzyme R subunit